MSVLEQSALAFRKGNRGAAWISVPWGGVIPLATYFHAHDGSEYLAAGGLLYSGLTVFGWMRSTLLADCETQWERYGATVKALGFVVLTEGTLVYPPKPWLGYVVLALLMVANAIAYQAQMVRDRDRSRGEKDAQLKAAVATAKQQWQAELEAEKEEKRQKRRESRQKSKSSGVYKRSA